MSAAQIRQQLEAAERDGNHNNHKGKNIAALLRADLAAAEQAEGDAVAAPHPEVAQIRAQVAGFASQIAKHEADGNDEEAGKLCVLRDLVKEELAAHPANQGEPSAAEAPAAPKVKSKVKSKAKAKRVRK